MVSVGRVRTPADLQRGHLSAGREGQRRCRINNPLPEAKEVVGGWYVIEAADDKLALELAKPCPATYGYVELRPVWD